MATSTSTEAQPANEIAQGPVGQRVTRADGLEKVRGEPVYYGDFNLPGMLYGRVLRSRYPHARILEVDTSRAKALPGVAAVAVAADIPGAKKIGTRMHPGDQPILCQDKVRFIGDAVALVAAETLEIASEAIELIEVRYEELPPLLDPKEAMLPGAPRVHEDRDNIVHHFKLRKGDVASAFDACAVIVENVYETPLVEHAYLEPEGCMADKSGQMMTVWTPTQWGFVIREQIAAMLNCPSEAVRVITTNAGGGFGGKEDACSDTACRAALLAHLTGRPVNLVYSREEAIISSSKRHAARVEYKTGADKDGRLLAIEARAYLNKGAYASAGALTPPAGGLTANSGFHLLGPYDIPNVHVDVYDVYTNLPFGGAMRGLGVPQMAFAHESQMDELAHRLGIDPVEIRLLNGLEAGKRTASNQLLENSVGLKETIRRAAERAGWKSFRQEKRAEGRIRRGMGIASFIFPTALGAWPEFTNATMEVDPETNQSNPYHVYAWGTQIAEVEVDTRTGMIKVKRVVCAQDVGKAINPAMVEAQMHGGVSMGLGFALSEELILNKGRVLNPSLANYLIPTAADTPEIVSIIVEDPYPDGPFGAKGVGEPGAVPTAGAIANAVFDAVGVRITRLPITAERVWRALQEKRKARSVASGIVEPRGSEICSEEVVHDIAKVSVPGAQEPGGGLCPARPLWPGSAGAGRRHRSAGQDEDRLAEAGVSCLAETGG